jgi:two-component system sensor histidine kinase VanS
MDWFIYISIGVVFFILFAFYLNRFTKYFYEINRGIDELIQENDTEITLAPELSSTEKKLNAVRQTLEKRKLDAQLAEQRKNDLVVYLAHDLKTPLASVIGYLCLLNEAPDMPEAQKEKYTGIALQKAYRLEELINEFFDITRFNLQSLVLNQSKIDLSLMLRQMADEFYPMLIPKGRKAAVHAPESLILTGDADKLARVFNNVLKNAIAYSYENSVIDISAERQDKTVVITFSDRGDPIPPQKLDTIFEKFYRLDSARSADTGGAGLGLAIAKEIVTAHGGTISAESGPEHTVFTVKLPL